MVNEKLPQYELTSTDLSILMRPEENLDAEVFDGLDSLARRSHESDDLSSGIRVSKRNEDSTANVASRACKEERELRHWREV